MLCHVCALRSELATDDGALAGNDMFRTRVVDVGLEIESQQDGVAKSARRRAVETQISLVFLEMFSKGCNVDAS